MLAPTAGTATSSAGASAGSASMLVEAGHPQDLAIIEAQLVETRMLATLSYQMMIASKAARVVTAAKGRDVVDFSARRGHGAHASLLAARAAVIGGAALTIPRPT